MLDLIYINYFIFIFEIAWNVVLNLTLCDDKAVPITGLEWPRGFQKLRFPDFMTMAQDGGKVVSLTHRQTLPPGNTPGTHFC
jgi:hypothetical protein